jgi:hypothetical protein
VLLCWVALLAAGPVIALQPGNDLLVPAAARVDPWRTDLFVANPGASAVSVTVQWLERGEANPSPASISFLLQPGETRVLADAILDQFGRAEGAGAFRVVAGGDVVVTSRIYAVNGATTVGQGFEGVPAVLATGAGTTTTVVGLVANAAYRTNVYALAGADGALMTLVLRDAAGVELARRDYVLGVFEPMLGNILDELGSAPFDTGTLTAEVTSGAALVGASRIDQLSDDPTTLESTWSCGQAGPALAPAGTYYGFVTTDRDRGARLTVNTDGEVVALSFQMGSTLEGCNFFFSGGGDFDPPVSLALFLGEEGVTFSNDYLPQGRIDWTVKLVEGAEHQHYMGSVVGLASGGPGSDACNGSTGAGQLQLGKQPP